MTSLKCGQQRRIVQMLTRQPCLPALQRFKRGVRCRFIPFSRRRQLRREEQ